MTAAEARRVIRRNREAVEDISTNALAQKLWVKWHHEKLMTCLADIEQAVDKLAEAQYEAGRAEQPLFGGSN